MQSPPSAIFFSIGNFHMHYYGLIMFIAIISGIGVMSLIAKKYYKDIDSEILLDIFPLIILAAILGARLYYVILDFAYYSKHLGEVFAVWNGGLSIHGALIAGGLAGFLLAKKYKFNFFEYADVFSFGLLIGQTIGRLGNYFNIEAFGLPTTLQWGLFVPQNRRPFEYMEFSYFHPTFLYEMIWNILSFCLLFLIMRRYSTLAKGSVFSIYLILYSVGRFFIEFLRTDSVLNIGNIPIAQVVCVIGLLIGIFALLFLNNKHYKP